MIKRISEIANDFRVTEAVIAIDRELMNKTIPLFPHDLSETAQIVLENFISIHQLLGEETNQDVGNEVEIIGASSTPVVALDLEPPT